MIVMTFNIQNKKNEDTKEKVDNIFNILDKEKIDIIGMQEVAPQYYRKLEENKKYNITGNYRLGKSIFCKIFAYIDSYNEATPIITKNKILYSKTIKLPWIPPITEIKKALFKYKSITPRIITIIKIKKDNQIITILNTHLEKRIEVLQKKQLKKILSIIKKIDTPFILMGDFNMKETNKLFFQFCEEISKLGGRKVSIEGKTLKNNRKDNLSIDHIFCRNFLVNEVNILDNEISDHYAVKVELNLSR